MLKFLSEKRGNEMLRLMGDSRESRRFRKEGIFFMKTIDARNLTVTHENYSGGLVHVETKIARLLSQC